MHISGLEIDKLVNQPQIYSSFFFFFFFECCGKRNYLSDGQNTKCFSQTAWLGGFSHSLTDSDLRMKIKKKKKKISTPDKVSGSQDWLMGEVNRGSLNKYKPIERLLWHKLYIALTKMKEEKHYKPHCIDPWCMSTCAAIYQNGHAKKYLSPEVSSENLVSMKDDQLDQ